MIGVVGCVVLGVATLGLWCCGSRTGGECQTVVGGSPVDETMIAVT